AGIVGDTANGSFAYQILQDNGINEYVLDRGNGYIFHHKYMLVDPHHLSSDPLVWTGSYNWSNAARIRNDENVVIVHNADITNLFYQEFSQRMLDNGVSLPAREFVFIPDFTFTSDITQPVVYPNPTQDVFYIDWKDAPLNKNMQIHLYNYQGSLVSSKTERLSAKGEVSSFNLEHLPAGIYFLKAVAEDYKFSGKIIVTK
ncbi:MAG: T9SS C-terminal target domain-containing protein, partial [Chitinophagaceae bacterium]